ncbi:putative reverse transcriptase domain-containing protein, partial [Tanacetum coccineum]
DDKDPEEDPVDYPADGGDDGDDKDETSEEDEDYDVDIEVDEDEEEEEHPAPADSIVVALPATDQAPSAKETEPFETDESTATPPPHPAYRVIARISIPAPVPTPVWSDAEVARLLAISTTPSSPTPSYAPSLRIPPPLPISVPTSSPPLLLPSASLEETQEGLKDGDGHFFGQKFEEIDRCAIPTKTAEDAKKAIQEMVEYSQKWHNGTSRGRTDLHSIRRIGSSQYAVSDGQNRASVSVMPLLTYLNLGLGELAHTRLTVELADRTMKYPKGIAENVLVEIGKFTFPIDFIILDMPEDSKVPLILGRPFLSTARSEINVYKRKITLKVREENIIFKSVKPASSLIRTIIRPFLEDYIELNDLDEPIKLRRNQGDDLMPTIEKGEVIEEFRIRDEDLDIRIDDYLSYYDYDKKIHIDYAHNLKFSCMIGFEFTHANFFPLLYVNVMSKRFHNSIMKDKMMYKGNNVVGTLMNVPIFVGNFSVLIFGYFGFLLTPSTKSM